MSVEPIRVELEAFCKQFAASLEPFNNALEQGTQSLREAVDGESVQSVLSDLQDNQHRLKIVHDKARRQHTYLVIFGPLKSGKSTLMNAISGAYVSEVSSLPAYPCLVYVREGEERGFSTTAFNGDTTEYGSRDELHSTLETAHEELARRIREADEAGRTFSPAQDFDRAIRRIDFTMPAPYLKESGTILVDTPGLYTKMKYNYGQLTRDFRNTAACAVFVVKTDNLFFEQVFEEFADLLEVFSRVFLVVNIDSSKQDLGPDGTLEPSLEQQDPKRIVEAFENLTVSSQIRSAIESGRLRIYLIDLLQTATRSLREGVGTPEGQGDEAAAEGETPDGDSGAATDAEGEDGAGEADESSGASDRAVLEMRGSDAPAEVVGPQVGFEAFLGDLTEYLNSSEYIVEFMADSLRQAGSIVSEVRERIHAPETIDFREGITELKEHADRAERQLNEVNALRDNQWDGPLEELSREIHQQVTEHAGAVLPELKTGLHREIDEWNGSDESMRDLVEGRLRPRLSEKLAESRQRAVQLFDGACATRNSGLRLSAEVVGRIHGLGLSFNDIYPEFQSTVAERFGAEPEPPDATGIQDALPLRKRFVDWILFRTEKRVRRLLMGDANPSEKPIPASVKAKRMGEEGINALYEKVNEYARMAFATSLEGELETLLGEYRDFFRQKARERLDEKVGLLTEERDTFKQRHEQRKNVLDALDQLDAASETLRENMRGLRDQFVAGKRAIEIEGDDAGEDGETGEDGESADGEPRDDSAENDATGEPELDEPETDVHDADSAEDGPPRQQS